MKLMGVLCPQRSIFDKYLRGSDRILDLHICVCSFPVCTPSLLMPITTVYQDE